MFSQISAFEEKFGYKLPASYIEVLRVQNGGTPKKSLYPAAGKNHVAISSIKGLGGNDWGLDGSLGQSNYYNWGYPKLGVAICDCPSGGHDVVVLDYRKCGRQMEKGCEPSVVHIDQELGYKRTFLAKDFATFIKGLKSENEADDLREQRRKKAEKKKGKKRERSDGNDNNKADSSLNRKRGKKDDSPESNADIIEELERQGAVEINRFKQKAYINAAKALKRCKKAIRSSKDIAHYKGIGKSAKILIDEVIAGRD
mmetsp:Transcript_34859/g.48519  ORF Transcript_34859/g.48519 Transcript_34859/m.48519 type:complete len:256 (+) Transcript_34859:190-957(+)